MSTFKKQSSVDGKSKQLKGTRSKSQTSDALLLAKKLAQIRKKETPNYSVKDIFEIAIEFGKIRRGDTGIIYEDFLTQHKCLWDLEHQERPERIMAIYNKCKEMGLLQKCKVISSKPISTDVIKTKHTLGHIGFLQKTCQLRNVNELELNSAKYDAVYFHPTTYDSSLLAVGCAVELIDSILLDKVQNGMAIIRPPGHHAMESEYCGYCFFNNVAIAAEYALNHFDLKRILIVDWDVHHGQGTQRMFYNDPRVVYFSIHRFEHGEFWPNLRESEFDHIGSDGGLGYNFNVPLNETGMGDSEYLQIFHQVLLPMAFEYNPELVIISCGYDAAVGCPEGEMNVSPACYAHLVGSLMSLARGRVAVILEGGYCLESLAESTALTLRALIGDPVPSLSTITEPRKSVLESIRNCIYAHKTYWKCYDYYDIYYQESMNKNKCMKHIVHVKSVEHEHQGSVTYPTRNTYPIQTMQYLNIVKQKLVELRSITDLSVPENKLCYIYDEKMMKHTDVNSDHPEKPSRIESVYTKHTEFGLLTKCKKLASRGATIRELLLVHSPEHIQFIWNTATMNADRLLSEEKKLRSIYLNKYTFESASMAAGSVLVVLDDILMKNSRSGLCIVRPPGHHAESTEACGFCIFNNAAICAKYAINNYNLERVLIVDWDVHHGNGTQNTFYKSKNVLYISLHRYDNGNFFPRGTAGNYTSVGEDHGLGYTVNIPWNKKGMTDADYIMAFHQVVMPIAYEYNPELVVISAGFDAAVGDPLGGCKVSPEAYGHMTHLLTLLANGRVLIALEGGYNCSSTAYCMTMCTKALLGEPLPPLTVGNIDITAAKSIRNVIGTHSKYWKSLGGRHQLPAEDMLKNKYFKQKVNKMERTAKDIKENILPKQFCNLSLTEG